MNTKSIKDNNEIIMNKDMTKKELKQVQELINIPKPFTKPKRSYTFHSKLDINIKHKKRKYRKHNTHNKKAYDEMITLSNGNVMLIQHIPECIHCKDQASIHVSIDDRLNEYYCTKHGRWTKYLKGNSK